MRAATRNGFLFTPSNEILGVNFGSDYCAEHEWGLKGIGYDFGLAGEDGIDRKTVHRVPGKDKTSFHRALYALSWADIGDHSGFAYSYVDTKDNQNFGEPFREFGRGSLWTAWSQDNFAVFSKKPEEIQYLHAIYDALLRKDACMWIGGGGPFGGQGFVIAIRSRIPKEVADNWLANDRKVKAVAEWTAQTGIEAKLRKAGKNWFYLGAKEVGERFWLNPTEQDKYEAGWYTLEDLHQWAENKGPVMKRRQSR